MSKMPQVSDRVAHYLSMKTIHFLCKAMPKVILPSIEHECDPCPAEISRARTAIALGIPKISTAPPARSRLDLPMNVRITFTPSNHRVWVFRIYDRKSFELLTLELKCGERKGMRTRGFRKEVEKVGPCVQLERSLLQRAMGIEPAPSAWELACHALPTIVFAAQRLLRPVRECPLQTVSDRAIGQCPFRGGWQGCGFAARFSLPWWVATGSRLARE
jgi:hypothetical protein